MVQNDGSGIQLGSATAACLGNAINGNVQLQQNTGSLSVFDNVVSGNLQCQMNTQISGAGNTAKQKQDQCAAF